MHFITSNFFHEDKIKKKKKKLFKEFMTVKLAQIMNLGF